MRFCPRCRYEFQDWVKVCPDCGVALVEKLSAPPGRQPKLEKHDEPLVHIATAPDELMANMWAGILEQEGIHPLLKGGNLYLFPLDPHCEIYVLASRADKATQILAPFLKDN